jgi:arylsulfatase A
LLFLLVVTCNQLIGTTRIQADERPNFLIILCDDLGYGDLACFGSKTIKTPHLDQLAEEGALLTSCYSTAPVCSASRAGLLTGRCPSRIGVYDWIPGGHPMHLRKEEVTIPQLLKKVGYQTSHVGKWHCNGKFNSPAQPQPGDHGFDHWYSTQNNASPSHENPKNFVRNGKPVGPQKGFSCSLVADEAIHWLSKTRDAKKPFFQFVCFHEPHEPIASPKALVEQYSTATKKGEALYYANVTNMDRAVGRLTKALDDLKLTDNTFVLFTSDNGPETLNRYGGAWRSHGSPGPLRGMKLHLYEAGIRVPSILRFPKHTKPGQVVDRAVCALDLLPTVCSLAKATPPKDRKLDGDNFLAALNDQKIVRHTPLYWHYFRSVGTPKAAMRIDEWMILGKWDGPALGPGGSVRPGDMKHIKTSKLVEFELYNLNQDMGQQTDLAKKHPEQLDKLKKLLVAKYNEVQAEGPVWKLPSKKK